MFICTFVKNRKHETTNLKVKIILRLENQVNIILAQDKIKILSFRLFGRLSTALYKMTQGERDNDNIIQLTI